MSEQETWLLVAVALLTPPIGLVFFNVLFLRVCMVEETVGQSLENYLLALAQVAKEKEKHQTRRLDFRRSRLGLSKAIVAEAAEGAEEGSLAAMVDAAGKSSAEVAAEVVDRTKTEKDKTERLDVLRSMGLSVPAQPEGLAPNGSAAVPAMIAAAANGGVAAPAGSAAAPAVPAMIAAAANGGVAAPAADGQPAGEPQPDQLTTGSGKISLLKALAAEPTSWPGGGGLDASPPKPVDPKTEAELGGAVRRLMSGGDKADS